MKFVVGKILVGDNLPGQQGEGDPPTSHEKVQELSEERICFSQIQCKS